MAIGDNWNDVDMLEWAGQGVMMANAAPELRAMAKTRGWKQAPSNDKTASPWCWKPLWRRSLPPKPEQGIRIGRDASRTRNVVLTWPCSRAALAAPQARAAERVTLRNGFAMRCDHHAQVEGRVRLYLSPGEDNYIEFAPEQIAAVEFVPDPPAPAAPVHPARLAAELQRN